MKAIVNLVFIQGTLIAGIATAAVEAEAFAVGDNVAALSAVVVAAVVLVVGGFGVEDVGVVDISVAAVLGDDDASR